LGISCDGKAPELSLASQAAWGCCCSLYITQNAVISTEAQRSGEIPVLAVVLAVVLVVVCSHRSPRHLNPCHPERSEWTTVLSLLLSLLLLLLLLLLLFLLLFLLLLLLLR